MSDKSYDAFLDSIIANLKKNGFPGRRVSLPLEKMYEVAHSKQLNFNKALTLLDEQGIGHERTSTRIVFFDAIALAANAADEPLVEPAAAPPGSMQEMMAKAAEMMQGMTPEQLSQLQRMVESMSDEDKAAMMQKAKDMGLAP